MKKSLLNYKSLNYGFLLLLLCANSGWSQTLFEETFGTTALATFAGGSSSPSVIYSSVTTSNNVISTSSISSGTDMFLNFAAKAITTQKANYSNTSTSVTLTTVNSLIQVGQLVTGTGIATNSTVTAISGTSLTLSTPTTAVGSNKTLTFFSPNLSNRCSLTAPFSSLTQGLNTTKLTDNTKLVTWTVNMRASRALASSSASYSDGGYYIAAVLCASTPNLTDGAVSKTDGYALIIQKSVDLPTNNPGAVRLVRFHNGIGSSDGGSQVSAALLATPALNAGALATLAVPNNVSLKVEYNPNSESWTMYYREDPIASGFVDPSSGTLTKIGSVVDATYTSTAMTHFGYLAGLSTSTNVENQLQLDNFKIALSDAPAYTAPPVVNKRQAFNTTPTPTVASLVGTGTGTLKWYDVAIDGTQLLPTDNLVNGKVYYCSLTNGTTESDRVATTVYVGNTALKTLPLYESFDYTLDDKLIVMDSAAITNAAGGTAAGIGLGSWTITPSSNITDDVTIVASPTWTNTVLPAATNKAISFAGSGVDPELKFTDTTNGSLYSSFVFKAADVTSIVNAQVAFQASADADYIKANPGALPPYPVVVLDVPGIDATKSTPVVIYGFGASTSTSSNGSASVMFRKVFGTTNKFNLGLSKSDKVEECVWSPTDFDFDTQHLIVISYKNIGGATATDQVASLWIDPDTSSPQPAATLSQSAPTTSVSRSLINKIKIQQASSSSTPSTIIDEIRVAASWSEVFGGPAPTALPVVEGRQAFNTATTPTVASLVAVGTDLKWYTADAGGSALDTSVLLTTANYYVSQTLNSLESDRVATNVYVGDTSIKTLPLLESFDYALSQSLIVMKNGATTTVTTNEGIGLGSWSITPSNNITADVNIVAGLTTTVIPASAGNAISFAGSGVDPELKFTDTTSGSLYSSFVFKAADVGTIVTAQVAAQASADSDYIKANPGASPPYPVVVLGAGIDATKSTPAVIYGFGASTSTSSNGSASVMFRKVFGTTNKFNLGLSKSDKVEECVWSPTDFDFDTQHLIVISYKNIGGATATDQVANLWIDPVTSSPQPEATLSQNNPTTSVSRSLINKIKIQQNSSASTPTTIIDEIRVAASWSEVFGGDAPPVPPVVEPRQVFDSNLEATVASLEAEGTDLKWYTADAGGSALDTSVLLTTENYYVSQTIDGLESDRVATNVYVGDTSLKTLLLYEPFDYALGQSLIVMKNGASTTLPENPGIGLGSWTINPTDNITADVAIVASPAWSTTVIPASVGNAISFEASGIDPELKFTDTTTGSLYSSFVFTAADVNTIVASTTTDPLYSIPKGFYSFSSNLETPDPITNSIKTTSNYAASVMLRKNIATGKFNLGLSKSNSETDCVWSPTEYDFGTQHLIVISYENIGDANDTNQVANLWIDPASSTQPAATLTQNNPISALDGVTPVNITRSNIDRIRIVQTASASTPTFVIDEIRVANNWGEALGGNSTLGLSSHVASQSQCTVYPNPVSNGKLYISSPSSSYKQVAIYSVLGQKVLDTKTTNNTEINVSKLAKGNYILKITEDGKSESKKFIIQ